MSTPTAPVLVCYDRSAGARHAIAYAGALFPGKRAVILNIWSFPLEMAVYGLGSVAAYSEDSQKKLATEAADEGCEIAREAGFVARPIVTSGNLDGTWRTILRVADEVDASVIVMGSRGLGGVRTLFLGSVSHGVVHHSHRPVLVVPPGTEIASTDDEGSLVSSPVEAR
jgi:nucleotide-binding universal stress UspA family protein